MKILVTGGAGYIGSVLIPKLLNVGYEVTVLDNLLHQQHTLIEHCNNPKFNFVYGDVRDCEVFHKEIVKADVIIHLAAYVGMPACKKYPREAFQTNLGSVEFLSRTATKDQLIIFPNTNSGYGMDANPGTTDTVFDETSPLNPLSLYGETKCEAEKLLLNNNNAISLRLATVFGASPRMRLDLLVNDFTYRAVNDKFIVLFEAHFKRNFVHIHDVTDTFLFCMDYSKTMTGQAYNVGLSSANISKRELCDVIKKYVPNFCVMESEIDADPDKRNYIVSNRKLESLGWGCRRSLDSGIQELIKAYSIIRNVHTAFTNV